MTKVLLPRLLGCEFEDLFRPLVSGNGKLFSPILHFPYTKIDDDGFDIRGYKGLKGSPTFLIAKFNDADLKRSYTYINESEELGGITSVDIHHIGTTLDPSTYTENIVDPSRVESIANETAYLLRRIRWGI